MTSSNPNFGKKYDKIGKNHNNCGVTGRQSFKYLFYTISWQKNEGKLSFEENLKIGVDIMTSH